MSINSKKKLNNEEINREYMLSLPSTSARVRYLDSIGLSRSEISNILYIRYQHVRNILITPIKSQR